MSQRQVNLRGQGNQFARIIRRRMLSDGTVEVRRYSAQTMRHHFVWLKSNQFNKDEFAFAGVLVAIQVTIPAEDAVMVNGRLTAHVPMSSCVRTVQRGNYREQKFYPCAPRVRIHLGRLCPSREDLI